MTERELEAIEARAEAATPGPWRVADLRRQEGFHDHVVARGAFTEIQPATDGHLADECNDVDFIAAARTDVPALLAEVRRLRALVKEQEWADCNNHDAIGPRCPWCLAERELYGQKHGSQCPAFTQDGDVR